MLTLITGQPGNGKTLYTLGVVEKLRQESGRPVYQSGIPDLTLPWEKLDDPSQWHTLPNGSIVVIDECQRVFPPRKQGQAVPVHVSEFETHRHRGFDVYLITQHPQLLDIAVRKLTGRHFHLVRTFGRDTAKVLQWERCVDPNDRSVKGEALTHRFDYPKERYGWYKSADIHTVKKDFPWKPVLVLAGSVGGIVVAFFVVFGMLKGDDVPTVHDKQTSIDGTILEAVDAPAAAWAMQSFVPRVPTWQWSAPFYDTVTQVQSAPAITGCFELRVGDAMTCRCSNGQGDAQVDDHTCHDYMRGRIYDPTKPKVDIKAENIAYLERTRGLGGESAAPSDGTAADVGQQPRAF